METLRFKVPEGSKARLRQLNRNMSALLREQVARLLKHQFNGSAYQKTERLCGGIKGGSKNAATSKKYLKLYRLPAA